MSTVVDTAPAATPAATPATTPAATPAPAPVANWYDGADPVVVGHLQNHGWHTKTPAEAALEIAKSHLEAQKHIGVPANQRLRVPVDLADADGWKQVWDKIGVPATPELYDLSGVKRADGKDVDEKLTTALRKALHDGKVAAPNAPAVARALISHFDEQAASAAAEQQTRLDAQKQKLADSWGANFEINKETARRAIASLGVGQEEAVALEGVIGYDRIMEMFRRIGETHKESSFPTIPGQGSENRPMTKEAAEARWATLKADKEWVAKFNKNDAQAVAEHRYLVNMMAGVKPT